MNFYESKFLRHVERLAAYLQGAFIMPLTLDVDLTNRCNCRCPNCAGLRQNNLDLKTEALERVLFDAKALGVKSIVFTGGGEPTLHRDFIRLLSITKEIGLEAAVVTNGVIFSKRKDIREAIIKNCTWIRVSVDAGNREMYKQTHGVDEYDNVIRGLTDLARENHAVTIGAAFLTGVNTVDGIDECCQEIKKTGIDYLYLRPFLGDTTPVDIVGFSEKYNDEHFRVIGAKAYNYFHETEKQYSKCGFGWWVSVIQADGNVTWCCRTRGMSKYYLGNIYDEQLATILNRRKNIRINLKDCVLLCRGDEGNRFLHNACKEIMHENFL